MRSLSKEAERKLIEAIEKAASLVNAGDKPTEAIIKSAREHDVPAGHINLMVHAYNTGRTTTQREKGENTLEKAAEFPLADANDVLKALYPETVKSSSQIKRAEAVSTEYALPVAGMLARRRDEMQKAAAATVALPEKTWTPPPRDDHAAVMRAQSAKIAAQRADEETRRQATAAYGKAANALEDLNIYFRTPGNMPFGDAVREVGLRFGDPGVSVLQKVAAVYPHFTKQADTNKAHFGDDPVYGLVQNVIDHVSAYNSAQAKVSVKKSDAVGKITAPKYLTKYLTGSILHEPEDEPLELKNAWDIRHKRDRNPADASDPYTGRANFSAGDKDLGAGDRPRLPSPPPTPVTPAGGDDMPLFNAVMDDVARREEDDKFQNFIDRQKAEVDAGRASYNAEKTRREAREFENEQRRQQREAERLQDEKLQDALFNESETARVQKERDMQYARKLKEEDSAKERAEAEAEMARLKQEKEREKKIEETWNKKKETGKNVGEFVSKTIKETTGNPLTGPAQFIGQLLGAKDLTALSPIKDKDPKSMLREQYQQLTDPSHENALKTIRAKSIVHDMVLNDPVISGHDPQDVAMAFNEIAELAPSLIDAPGMLRPLLRKRLESGQLADFDVKQILEMDKLRADRDKALMEIKDKTLNLL